MAVIKLAGKDRGESRRWSDYGHTNEWKFQLYRQKVYVILGSVLISGYPKRH